VYIIKDSLRMCQYRYTQECFKKEILFICIVRLLDKYNKIISIICLLIYSAVVFLFNFIATSRT